MFYGLAIVCASGDGTEKHLVREGENGTFFCADDRESLSSGIARLLKRPEDVQRMGQRSRLIVDQEVNISTVVEAYREAFTFACA
jgi:glycosyltransferase involved in cell wall biosynthesis